MDTFRQIKYKPHVLKDVHDQSEQYQTSLNKFEQVWTSLDKFEQIKYEPHVLKDVHDKLADALLVVDPPDHLDADLGDLVIGRELQADLLEDLDDAFTHADAGVQDAVGDELVILCDQGLFMQDELADEVDGGLAHHGGRVFERILHCILAIWQKQNFGVLGDDHGHAFERFSPASSNKKAD